MVHNGNCIKTVSKVYPSTMGCFHTKHVHVDLGFCVWSNPLGSTSFRLYGFEISAKLKKNIKFYVF